MSIVLFFAGITICWILYKNDTLYFKYYLEFWYKSFNFKGNTKRNKFWIAQAWSLLFLIFLVLIGLSVFYDVGNYEIKTIDTSLWTEPTVYKKPLAFIREIFDFEAFILIPFKSWVIVSFIPSISIQIRRLRDTARNPLWILTSLIPFFGGLLLLIFYLSPSKKRKIKNKLEDKLEDKLKDKLKEVENLLTKGTIDQEEYKYMRKKILTKYMD